jgi:allantoinase
MFEQVIRNGMVVTPEGVFRSDVAIEGGKIVAVGPELPGGRSEIDAAGLHIFPGVMDVHLHFNEPGRTEWEGAATGSRALAAGGGTTFFDMPLNSTPCTVNAAEFQKKRAALEEASIADFGLWGGLIPGNVGEFAGMAECGAVGFKAFMSNSGLPEFPRADDLTLYEGLCEAARLGLPVSVHAESEEITAGLSKRFSAGGVPEFLSSRPVVAEVEAIKRATALAKEAGAKLHIVHISSGKGVTAAAEAKASGVDVSIETCAHYLFFTEEDIERLGAIAKCAPPLRDQSEQSALWHQVVEGVVEIVASDHSPAPPSMKTGDFLKAWGGIAGVQSTLSVLLTHGLRLERIVSLCAARPAQRFQIPNKGAIAMGNDADLVLVDLDAKYTLKLEDLHQRHPLSPYLGREFQGRIRRTIRTGETIFLDGAITAQSRGKFLRPDHNASCKN